MADPKNDAPTAPAQAPAAATPEQPAQPAAPPPPQTVQQQLDAQRETLRVATKIAPILKGENPHIVTLALLRVAATTALHTQFTPEQLAGWVIQAYGESKAANEAMMKDPRVLAMLGIKPGEELPADIEERVKKFMEQAASGQLQPPPTP